MLLHIRIYWRDTSGLIFNGGFYSLRALDDCKAAMNVLLGFATREAPFSIRVCWDGMPEYWAHSGDVMSCIMDMISDCEAEQTETTDRWLVMLRQREDENGFLMWEDDDLTDDEEKPTWS